MTDRRSALLMIIDNFAEHLAEFLKQAARVDCLKLVSSSRRPSDSRFLGGLRRSMTIIGLQQAEPISDVLPDGNGLLE